MKHTCECLIEGCTQPARTRGLCLPHYGHHRYRGDLDAVALPAYVPTFWGRVDMSGGPDACWPWTGAINGHGYGSVSELQQIKGAHRVAYERTYGPIPEGMTLDHTCHPTDGSCPGGRQCLHRRCVNPRHLAPMTAVQNTMRGLSPHAQAARQTHCAQGHEFTPDNTVYYPSRPNARVCLECKRASARETQRRKGAEAQRLYMRQWRAKRRQQ